MARRNDPSPPDRAPSGRNRAGLGMDWGRVSLAGTAGADWGRGGESRLPSRDLVSPGMRETSDRRGGSGGAGTAEGSIGAAREAVAGIFTTWLAERYPGTRSRCLGARRARHGRGSGRGPRCARSRRRGIRRDGARRGEPEPAEAIFERPGRAAHVEPLGRERVRRRLIVMRVRSEVAAAGRLAICPRRSRAAPARSGPRPPRWPSSRSPVRARVRRCRAGCPRTRRCRCR